MLAAIGSLYHLYDQASTGKHMGKVRPYAVKPYDPYVTQVTSVLLPF